MDENSKYWAVWLGNIPPLVRLLQAYICKGSESVAASDKLVGFGSQMY